MGAPNRQVLLAERGSGLPTEDWFTLVDAERPEPASGQVLLHVIDLSLDPYLRSLIAGRHLGEEPLSVGTLVPGRALARVVDSRDVRLAAGALVVAETGWQEWAVAAAGAVEPVAFDTSVAPPSAALGVLGMPGLAAYAGVTELLRPRAGDVFVVSAPLGPVGSAAGQLARIQGCRTIGISSSPAKCRIAVDRFGFEACVDRTQPGWADRLRECCPDGIDHYLDNAGGEVLDAMVEQLGRGGRIALCGLMEQYNDGPVTRIRAGALMAARATVRGLIVYDHLHLLGEMRRRFCTFIGDGRLRLLEDRAEGLDQAPGAFCRMMRGENIGKALIRVSDADHLAGPRS
jgi:NADPH-dependent curcumin reductase CurA